MSIYSTIRTGLTKVHELERVKVLATSPTNWRFISLSRLKLQKTDILLPSVGAQTLILNCGEAVDIQGLIRGERLGGRSQDGHLVLCPHNSSLQWTLRGTGDFIIAMLDQDLLRQVIAESGESNPDDLEIQPRFLIHDMTLERVLHILLRETRFGGTGSQAYADALALVLAVHLIRYHSNLRRAEAARHRMAPRRLRQVMEFIEAHYREAVSLDDMAKIADMSRYHFARSFQASTGHSPYHYLTERRLQEACALLNGSNLAIAEIAHKTGFHSQSHFTRLFCHYLGMTPRRFRSTRSA